LREFTRFICRLSAEWLPTLRPSTDLGCESAENWLLLSIFTIAIVIITRFISWHSFYCSTNGGRLSRPRHCSKGAQPVPKAVYRGGRHDKHINTTVRGEIRDLGFLAPQSDALTIGHCDPMHGASSAVAERLVYSTETVKHEKRLQSLDCLERDSVYS